MELRGSGEKLTITRVERIGIRRGDIIRRVMGKDSGRFEFIREKNRCRASKFEDSSLEQIGMNLKCDSNPSYLKSINESLSWMMDQVVGWSLI